MAQKIAYLIRQHKSHTETHKKLGTDPPRTATTETRQ